MESVDLPLISLEGANQFTVRKLFHNCWLGGIYECIKDILKFIH